jgi:tRNA (cytidine/uridine-2'-O-)-methyltransferase
MFNIVLVEPEIPQNTGNIVRTCAATGCKLHLVRPLGFEVSDKYLKRAGLDYWHFVEITYWDSFDDLLKANPEGKFYYFTTKGRHRHSDVHFEPNDFLVFGKETKGLPEELLIQHPDECLRIPMIDETRSLNLSNSVAIAVYEGLRQHDYEHMKVKGELHRLNWDTDSKKNN